VLEGAELSAREAMHRAALRRAVTAFAAARVLLARDQPMLAAAVLRRLGGHLDPVRDVYVRTTQEQRLAAVPGVRASPPRRGFGHDVLKGFVDVAETILRWLLVIGALALTGIAIYLLRREVRKHARPHSGVGIALEDLSAETDRRTDANRTLGRELSIAIAAASAGGSADGDSVPEIDVAMDLDGSVSVNVRVTGDELAAFSRLLDGGSEVRAGPVSVSPRQLVAFAGAFFARRYTHSLTGSLVAGDQRTTLAVDLNGDGQAVGWSCEKAGTDSRPAAVAEIAQRVVFQLGERGVSQSWPSVAAYREARRRLASAPATAREREGRLDAARQCLERSLAHDPTNLLAHFELGNVLRKLGSNDEAVHQYALLEEFAATRAISPLLLRAAIYSRAIALSKIGTWPTHHEALTALEALEHGVNDDNRLAPADRDHLLALICSARAAALIFELERLRDEPGGNRVRARRQSLFEQIHQARDWIDAPERRRNASQPAYYQALAVAENALGRAIYVIGDDADDAIAAFERALSLVPDLGDAHVNLASAVLRQSPNEPGWEARVRRHLDQALELSPQDRKALYLLGKVALRLDDQTEARRWFTLAARAGDAWAMFRLAELDHQQGKVEQALDELQKSLVRLPGADVRARLFVLWTAQVTRDSRPDVVRLAAARRAGDALERDARRRKAEPAEPVRRALRLIDAVLDG
jgi:tetratricopeptide (TPR) repeat protein